MVFVENEKWDWKRSNEETELDVLEWGDEEEIRMQESGEGENTEIAEADRVDGVNVEAEEIVNAETEEVDRGVFNSPSGDLNANT